MAGHAAIQYSPSGFDTRVGKMMGRQVAGGTFLQAWIEHGGADPLTGFVHTPEDGEAFRAHARELGATGDIAVAGPSEVTGLEAAGALWLADPSIGQHAWWRRWRAQDAWSIVGITHTISSHAAMDRVAALLTAPTQRWDALVCTSRSVEKAVAAILEAEAEYLASRVGAKGISGPLLPVIPLGVSCGRLAHDPAARARWRAELKLAEDDLAVLVFGRQLVHTKAHPLPLCMALAEAARRSGRRFHLILAGHPTPDEHEALLLAMLQAFADRIGVYRIDGSRLDAPGLRSAADIAALLSDNIQESFGLAPVEAMAAGLPVVGSDWDGLRDTIEHGVTGILVPTTVPEPGTGDLLARRYDIGVDTYDQYSGGAAQMTAVDIAAAADAFVALADPAVRRRMGEAGRARAAALFDWRHVIAAYRALLDDLAGRRRAGTGERAPRGPGRPARPSRADPFLAFAGHATARLTGGTRLALAPGAPAGVADLPSDQRLTLMAPGVLPTVAVLDAMRGRLAGGAATLDELADAFPDTHRHRVAAGAAWLLKFGFARRVG